MIWVIVTSSTADQGQENTELITAKGMKAEDFQF